ncbi:hypothetical protein BKA67DRAFT_527068 [Truncatella angustata]|uniref:LysM domain-containing protein n=1 Tax=Truncatella angustata TaxID=152316 RepID=A0A9P8UBL5_9PEZI|nr:uncharacterized protein BKA67DRAFT_527068 [Truncatella angustata]KAH6645531.1 hypothetical protein BKA67DRAFT_527068 [Truncatella angustata]
MAVTLLSLLSHVSGRQLEHRDAGLHRGLFSAAQQHKRDVTGWSIFSNGSLSTVGLDAACESAMYQTIACDGAASILMTESTVNSTRTELVCTADCETSIANMASTVAEACVNTPNLATGLPLFGFVDTIWSNWNQSCFTDPETGDNCNDFLAALPSVADVSNYSESDLCSYCYTEKLALMQASAYSDTYNDDSQTVYEYVAGVCNLTVTDFNATESVFQPNITATSTNCVSGNTYTTQAGDTCDSIAIANSVSAATMYYTNPNILNCSSIFEGTSLCLPATCDNVYSVVDDDTCLNIAVHAGTITSKIITWNSQLNWNCSNLQDPNPYWGSTLCVSSPGGNYTGTAASNSTDFEATVTAVDPPSGATVADGTTLECLEWYTYDASLTCVKVMLTYGISVNLFVEANPSVGLSTCDDDLVVGDAYCVEPMDNFNQTSTSTTSTAAASTVTAPGPTLTGTASNCNAYYVVESE